jgi:tetratricopeptide (TPR) repeat protein
MKSLSFSLAATALVLGIPTGAATAGIVTIGNNSMAADCFGFAERRDSRPEALTICSRALRFEPLDQENRASTLVNRGVLQMVHKQYAAAEQDFDSALALDQTQSDAWLNKGFLRLRTGDGAAALPFLERAMKLHMRRPALVYFARGIALEQSGDIRAAFADLNRARDMEPGWAMPAQALARYQVVAR